VTGQPDIGELMQQAASLQGELGGVVEGELASSTVKGCSGGVTVELSGIASVTGVNVGEYFGGLLRPDDRAKLEAALVEAINNGLVLVSREVLGALPAGMLEMLGGLGGLGGDE